MNASQKALKALEYIKNIEFNSFNEFVQKAITDGQLTKVKNALGEITMYRVVCEITGEEIDTDFAEMLSP